jgi:hypothetical protein
VKDKVDEFGPEEGVGLAVSNGNTMADVLHTKGFVFYSFHGGVFADGLEKTTRLPAAKSGSVVTFDTDVIQSNKVRVTIEVNDKIITFDWLLPDQSSAAAAMPFLGGMGGTQLGAGHDKISLFFVSCLCAKRWSVTVE